MIIDDVKKAEKPPMTIEDIEKELADLKYPEPPEDGMCCGNGCQHCVWFVYLEEMDAYQKRKDELENSKKVTLERQ